ncbi:MAG: dihydrofolate reductase [Lachnospiraceae bacterium]|nr:dihydrofolate reductase [Lachnospiraceae bacterium]
MNCIVAVDNHWGIGRRNGLLVSIPADMRFFRTETTGKTVIMGRTTLESFPGGKPLKNRFNIVVTRDPNYKVPDAAVVHSVEEAAELAKAYPSENVYVIGGASIYRQFLPYCDTAYVTKIDYLYDADTFFPDLDADPEWECTEESEEQTYYDIIYRFTKYVRKPRK